MQNCGGFDGSATCCETGRWWRLELPSGLRRAADRERNAKFLPGASRCGAAAWSPQHAATWIAGWSGPRFDLQTGQGRLPTAGPRRNPGRRLVHSRVFQQHQGDQAHSATTLAAPCPQASPAATNSVIFRSNAHDWRDSLPNNILSIVHLEPTALKTESQPSLMEL